MSSDAPGICISPRDTHDTDEEERQYFERHAEFVESTLSQAIEETFRKRPNPETPGGPSRFRTGAPRVPAWNHRRPRTLGYP